MVLNEFKLYFEISKGDAFLLALLSGSCLLYSYQPGKDYQFLKLIWGLSSFGFMQNSFPFQYILWGIPLYCYLKIWFVGLDIEKYEKIEVIVESVYLNRF